MPVLVTALPEVVRATARARGADAWLAGLPALVADLERAWGLTVGRPFGGATEALVAEATLAHGTPAVLKLLVPWDGGAGGGAGGGAAARHEVTVLRLAGGGGCVGLLRCDEARGALLLERLGPSLFDLGVPLRRRRDVLVAAAARVWRPAPGCGLPTGADKGRGLAGSIAATWEALGRPCSAAAVDHALACAERRVAAHDDERAVLVHGDVHQWNALAAGDGFKLVDPDGLLAEAEYDLGVLLREDPLALLVEGDPERPARELAARTGLDATAIWEWGVVERVATGLRCAQVGLEPVGRQMLAAADRLAARTAR